MADELQDFDFAKHSDNVSFLGHPFLFQDLDGNLEECNSSRVLVLLLARESPV
jgi:hypothetical protein